VPAEELIRFMDGLETITPSVGDALEAAGEPRTPDMEMPVLWMSSVGHAVARTLPTLAPEAQRALFDAIERGMASGGELLRTALATGLLEALAHDMDRAVVPRDLVTPLLGTGARAYLNAWETFTLGEGQRDSDRELADP
jgi:hypothetical protein